MLNNKRLLILFLAALTLLLVACGAPPIPETATAGDDEVVNTAVVEEPFEAEPTPEAELEVETEADETVEEEAEVTVEEATTAVVIEELPLFTILNFTPGQCLIELSEPTTVYRAADLDIEQGTIEAGTYGITSFVQLDNETSDQFFGVPMPDSRLVYVQFTSSVLLVTDCPGVAMANQEQPTSTPEPEAVSDEPTLVGTVWVWQSITTPVVTVNVPNPEAYTLAFNEDGTVSLQADCKQVGGTFAQGNGAINIALDFNTAVVCSSDSLDTTFLDSLSRAALYFFQDGDLYLDLPADSGTMHFTEN